MSKLKCQIGHLTFRFDWKFDIWILIFYNHMSMFSKLKQFKDLRDQGKKLQGALAGEAVTVRAEGDKIALTMDGNLQITGLAIDDELLNPSKKEKLQNGLKTAHSDALKKMQKIMATKMQEMGGFNLPGMS